MLGLSPKSPNPSVFGQAVTLTATVSAVVPASGTPTGSVTFLDGSITLGTATLSTGGRRRVHDQGASCRAGPDHGGL